MGELYSALKFLRYPDHVDAVRDGNHLAPVHIRIKPINHCNHGCWYCAYRADQLQLGESMDLDDRIPEDKMDEIIDDIVDMGVKAVTFSGGGEPLLYRSLPNRIERLSRGGVRIAALTNGSNLKGRMADAFAEHGTWVRVSIDGWDDESYSAARGIPVGSFSAVIDNMRSFVARKSNCTLGASFIVGKANHAHLFEACSLLKNVGVDHVKVSAAVVSNDVGENFAYHREIMDEVMEQISRARSLNDQRFTILEHYHETEECFDKDYDRCPYLTFLTVIGADCIVYTCQDKAYSEGGTLGSIAGRSFREFWFSDEIISKIRSLDPSRDCRHHCVSHKKNLALLEVTALDGNHAHFV